MTSHFITYSLKTTRSLFDHFAEQFDGISSDTIHRICERLSDTNSILESSNMTGEERRILQLMKEVNVINRHVPGSSAAHIAMRNEICALIMDKGLPSFYILLMFTIPLSNFSVMILILIISCLKKCQSICSNPF